MNELLAGIIHRLSELEKKLGVTPIPLNFDKDQDMDYNIKILKTHLTHIEDSV